MSADPGYGPNGVWLASSGLVSWDANPPPKPVLAANDVWRPQPLGITFIPIIYQKDEEVWSYPYLGAP